MSSSATEAHQVPTTSRPPTRRDRRVTLRERTHEILVVRVRLGLFRGASIDSPGSVWRQQSAPIRWRDLVGPGTVRGSGEETAAPRAPRCCTGRSVRGRTRYRMGRERRRRQRARNAGSERPAHLIADLPADDTRTDGPAEHRVRAHRRPDDGPAAVHAACPRAPAAWHDVQQVLRHELVVLPVARFHSHRWLPPQHQGAHQRRRRRRVRGVPLPPGRPAHLCDQSAGGRIHHGPDGEVPQRLPRGPSRGEPARLDSAGLERVVRRRRPRGLQRLRLHAERERRLSSTTAARRRTTSPTCCRPKASTSSTARSARAGRSSSRCPRSVRTPRTPRHRGTPTPTQG